MNRLLYILVVVSSVCTSCIDMRKNKVMSLINEWQGKEILYPTDTKFVDLNGNPVLGDSLSQDYKVFSYVDSIGCMSCKLKLAEWESFIFTIDSLYPDLVSFQFIFQPYKVRELQLMLKRSKLSASVYVDTCGKFARLNRFPNNMNFQTYLLDRDNKVLAIGNPIHNHKVKELYLKIIRGERGYGSKQITTQVDIAQPSVSMRNFDWEEEQKATFTLKNTGDNLLVIQDVTTSCGCTTVSYDKAPVQPGAETTLEVSYKAERPGYFNKTLTVYCNVENSPLTLRISGNAK